MAAIVERQPVASSGRMRRNISRLCGLPLDRVTVTDVLQRLDAFLQDGQQHLVFYVNASGINQAVRDRHYAGILQEADLVCADGMGVVWASRLTDQTLPERVNIGDLLEPFFTHAATKHYRLFLLAGQDGVAAEAADRLKRRFAGLQVVGTHHGFFPDNSDEAVVEKINKVRPDVLLVGMGVPKQEKWIWRNRRSLRVPVIWAVGAALDYQAGQFARAPHWMRQAGLEWLFRLALEPGRLWRRYLIGNALFILRVCARIITDACLVMAAWLAAYVIRLRLNAFLGVPINAFDAYGRVMPLLVVSWLAVCAAAGLYRRLPRMPFRQELLQVAAATCLGLLMTMATGFFLKELGVGRSVVLLNGMLMCVMLTVSRTVFRWQERCYEPGRFHLQRTLIVGTGWLAGRLKNELNESPLGYDVVGVLSDGDGGFLDSEVLGHMSELATIVDQERIDDVFVASQRLSLHDSMNLLGKLGGRRVNVHVVSEELARACERLSTRRIGALTVFDVPYVESNRWYEAGKRFFDVCAALIGLIVVAPLLMLIGLLVAIDMKGSPLFSQLRVAKQGRLFRMYKFRTMFAHAAAYEEAPNDLTDPRVTCLGRLLRRWSLDELPQLFNVLKGEMSFVGPRPEMPFLVERYEPWQHRRHEVKPGLTGLWQVLGRKHLPLLEHLEYDLYYISHCGWKLDTSILLRTLPAVISRRGAF